MLKIYGQYRSRAFRVIWLCKESNIPFEHVDVTINVPGATCKEPWFTDINPNARVPAIVDGPVTLWETPAINLWLAEKYQSPLWPKTIEARAPMLQWAFFVAHDVEPSMITVLQHRVMFPPEKRNAALADEADQKLQTKLAMLDAYLAKQSYFSGTDQWNMADFMVACVCYTLYPMKYDLSRFPHFHKWLQASIERPAAREARALRE